MLTRGTDLSLHTGRIVVAFESWGHYHFIEKSRMLWSAPSHNPSLPLSSGRSVGIIDPILACVGTDILTNQCLSVIPLPDPGKDYSSRVQLQFRRLRLCSTRSERRSNNHTSDVDDRVTRRALERWDQPVDIHPCYLNLRQGLVDLPFHLVISISPLWLFQWQQLLQWVAFWLA
jgi:hypothetical protein